MYDFIHNLPILLPIDDIGNNFSKFLNKYPVTPYLDSRNALMRWVHFIHNKINISLNKKTITFEESMTLYYEHYKPKEIKLKKIRFYQEKKTFLILLIISLLIAIYLYYNYI
jgi:hypothetical protein